MNGRDLGVVTVSDGTASLAVSQSSVVHRVPEMAIGRNCCRSRRSLVLYPLVTFLQDSAAVADRGAEVIDPREVT